MRHEDGAPRRVMLPTLSMAVVCVAMNATGAGTPSAQAPGGRSRSARR